MMQAIPGYIEESISIVEDPVVKVKQTRIINHNGKHSTIAFKYPGLSDDNHILYHADPECEHEIQPQWSGIKCVKCGGWYCA